MLKGVNKHVVEVVDMENEYFEKAILFLRPGRPGFDESTLLPPGPGSPTGPPLK